MHREIPFGRPLIGEAEKQAVLDVLDGPILVHGPRAKQFEAEFAQWTGAPHAVSVSSCTAAMHLVYFSLGLDPGDEVIVPAQTHVATAHAVELCGAKPVFIDAERQTGNIDIDQLETLINTHTRAIAVVHYLGMPVNMDRVMTIAKKYDLFVLEDCALAMGTYLNGKHAGLHGDAGCFSFYPVKHMTTAEGGMLITRHENLATKVTRQKAFGVDRHMGERQVPGIYDVNMLGFNYRLNEIQAALGSVQLTRMNTFLEKRQQNEHALRSLLKDVAGLNMLQTTHHEYQSSYYCSSVILDNQLAAKRFELVNYLKSQGVGTSVYYPRPVPHMRYYQEKYGYTEQTFPVASWISYQSIALPIGPHLTTDDMTYIVEKLKEGIEQVG